MKYKLLMNCLSALLITASNVWAYQVIDEILPNAMYIDIRSINAIEYFKADVPGAIWVNPHSLMDINDFLKSSNKKKSYIIFCACPHDEYSTALAEMMDREGFTDVSVLHDGWDVLEENNLTKRRI